MVKRSKVKAFARNIKDLIGLKISSISHPIELQQNRRCSPKLRSNLIHRAPRLHHVCIMNDLNTVHFITATRQWDPQHLPDRNIVRIGYIIKLSDFWERYQSWENLGSDMVQPVIFYHLVLGGSVDDTCPVFATASDGDFDRLIRLYGRVWWRGGVEAVGS